MAVMIECPKCRSQYRAGDNLAGRRIKCRRCGAIVAVPLTPSAVGEVDLDSLEAAEEFERKAGSSEAKAEIAVGAERPQQVDPLDVAEATSISRGPRANALFDFPWADRVDQFLPWLVTAITIVCTVRIVAWYAAGREPWLGSLRALLALIFYAGVVFPICLVGLYKGLRSIQVGMPFGHLLRSFAAFSVPFAMGYVPWLVTGNFVDMVSGGIFGLAIGLGLVWLLYRLRADQLPAVLPPVGAAIIAGLTLCVLLMMLANLVTLTLVKGYHVKQPISGSPFGPAFAWLPPAQAPSPGVPARPDASVPLVTTGQGPSDPAGAARTRAVIVPERPVRNALLKSGWPLVAEIYSPLPEAFDEIIYPAVPSSYAAILRRTGAEEDRIELWQTVEWQQTVMVRFKHEPNARDRYILSANGDYVVRIVNWPRLAAQVWSFRQGRVVRNIDWPGRESTPELLGFTGDDVFLVQWTGSDQQPVIEQWEASSGQMRGSKGRVLPHYEPTGGQPAISPDGRYLAVAAKAPVTGPRAGVFEDPPAGSSTANAVQVFDLAADQTPVRIIPITVLDPRWPLTPTGMAFSPDSSTIALLFEHNQNVLLLCWRLSDGAQLAEYVYPASPIPEPAGRAFPGTVLDWVGPGAWCLCGQVLINAGTSQPIGSFDLLTRDNQEEHIRVIDQRVNAGGAIEIVYEARGGQRQLAVIVLAKPASVGRAPATRSIR